MFKNKAVLIIASAMLALPATAQAQGATPTAGKGGSVSGDQLVSRYSTLAGGASNAKSVVNGLRNGADITLTFRGPDEPIFEKVQTGTRQVKVGTEPIYETRPVFQTQMRPCTPPQVGICPVQVQVGTQQVQVGTRDVFKEEPIYEMVQTGTKPGALQTVSFPPGPAAPMGFGNVDIALALTEARLRPNATPTGPQFKDALLEILNKRAGGDGWGEIAKGYGFDLK